MRLSGGQRQRLALARAFIAQPKVLCLDEPTSAVEPESEVAIIEAIRRLMQGRTTIIVSHRLSLAHAADRVLVMSEGQVVEDGTPTELLSDPSSRFSRMCLADRQFAEGKAFEEL